ncbi:GNAT family N-acetyltransferase [Jeotgalibacillus marinus]|uniref:GNAT family N-acetyltransferase n=1 Tax=Jeotgalibacillus marinus TaxID=86667 RepID=A0ABV3Q6D5_9BACL
MTIRKATYSETQTILNYSLVVLKEATMGSVEQSQEKALQLVSPFLSDGGFYLVHIENNVIQGWIGVGKIFDYYTDEMVGFIPEIFVLPQYRKQGIAEKLCMEAFSKLKEHGYQKVQLNVFSGNPVKNLYYKLGFNDVSTLMQKDLDLSP